MAGAERIFFLFIPLLVSLLLSNGEHCPAIQKHQLFWRKVSLGTNVTKDCFKINSTWTGEFTAKCRRNIQGNVTWYFNGDCGCEVKSVLLYYQAKVSKVNQTNFVETADELRNAFVHFINRETYRGLMSRLKNSMCKRTPKLKSAEWDKIQEYCQMWGENEDFERQLQSQHFEKHFCHKVESGSSSHKEIGLPSFGGSKKKTNSGVTVVDLNESGSQRNLTQAVNDSGCTVTSYHMKNGKITITAKRKTTDSGRKERLHEKRRKLVELILMCVSLVAITFSLIILSCIRSQSTQSTEKLFIHKNFLLSWGIGNAIHIVDATAFESINQRAALCTAVSVAGHFFYTAVFTWMLVEAVNLFIKLVKVISTRTFYMTYLAVGWGIPAVIVTITAAARTKTYDMNQPIVGDFMCGSRKFTSIVERTSCWLNGSKWLYTGPVLAILLVNLVIFVMLLKVVFSKLGTKYNNDKLLKTRKGLKSVAALLPLLGVTWLFGFFVDLHEVLDYIFILLTSTQGIVFCVFHCILDGQVRKAIRQRFKNQSHINKNVSPGKRRMKYTVNRNAGMEFVKKQMPNETNETFKELT